MSNWIRGTSCLTWGTFLSLHNHARLNEFPIGRLFMNRVLNEYRVCSISEAQPVIILEKVEDKEVEKIFNISYLTGLDLSVIKSIETRLSNFSSYSLVKFNESGVMVYPNNLSGYTVFASRNVEGFVLYVIDSYFAKNKKIFLEVGKITGTLDSKSLPYLLLLLLPDSTLKSFLERNLTLTEYSWITILTSLYSLNKKVFDAVEKLAEIPKSTYSSADLSSIKSMFNPNIEIPKLLG